MPERRKASRYQPVGQRASVGEARPSYGSHRRPADNRGASPDSRADARSVSNVSSDDAETASEASERPPLPSPPPPKREQESHPSARHMPTLVDWRAVICHCLEISPEISDHDLSKAMDEVSEKVKEIDRLRATARKRQGPPRAQIVHRVECRHWRSDHKYFLDQPWVVETGPFDAHLRGSQPINNFELYLERNKEIVFIVYKHYECCARQVTIPPREQGEIGLGIDASFLLQWEEIFLIAPELKEALVQIADVALEGIPHPDFEESRKILHPYIWYFHRRTEIHAEIDKLPRATRLYVDCFRGYIESRMEEEWQSVESLMKKGNISAQYLKYLIVPGQIIISQGNTSTLAQRTASVAEGWLRVRQTPDSFSASVPTYTWAFDGNFSKTYADINIHDVPSLEEPFDILDLGLYPMEFASEGEIEALRKRGRMFWKCRTRNYVSLHTESEDDMQNSMSARFMVDIATHKQMHPNDKSDRVRPRPEEDELEAKYMSQDDPDLGDDFFMCLPTSIPGFIMLKKEWVNLDVHYIRDVVWNTEAFEFLVIERETKLLVQAVVTNRVRASENTDLITGKGNGLFILLHGGPGTGKTLTAESVAEIAQRPLYRVTCGDIGTKAEEVENYLEFVLLLGKKWGCVVLLDEADVFLEQRSVSNLERNALVTVFLRVLEYYDGITRLSPFTYRAFSMRLLNHASSSTCGTRPWSGTSGYRSGRTSWNDSSAWSKRSSEMLARCLLGQISDTGSNSRRSATRLRCWPRLS
ncbi:hypothetical protein FJTKL_09096 [Diaporthe vaccinii]|uniref:AAA+ ATPase domain-containing protein n=1 Tax=Diaporthe vaccinii TaxID=105482 RepID=A0ABR4ENS3_9PEZI